MSSQLDQAIAAINAGDNKTGQRLLTEIVQANPRDDLAWVWLARAVSAPERKEYCLKRALAINPHNREAQIDLQNLRQKPRVQPAPPESQPPLPVRSNPILTPIPPPSPPARHSASAETELKRIRVWLAATLTILAIVIIGAGCLAVVFFTDLPAQFGFTPATPVVILVTATPVSVSASPAVTPTLIPPTVVPATPSATLTAVMLSPTLPTPPSPSPTVTPLPPSPTTTPLPTSTSTPSPTPTASPTVEQVNSLGDAALASGNVDDFVGAGFNYYSLEGNSVRNWQCTYTDASGGQTTLPRLYGNNTGQIWLMNFQPYEAVQVFVYDSSGYLTGSFKPQIGSDSQLKLQLTGAAYHPDDIYVAIGDYSGEVINASGPALCRSIQKVTQVEARFNTELIRFDQQGNPIEIKVAPPGARFEVISSYRTDLDTLWWRVDLEDEQWWWVRNDQVERLFGSSIEVTPPSPPTPTTPSLLLPAVTPEQAVQEYYDLILQGRYQESYNRLTQNFKASKSPSFAEYSQWASQWQDIQVNIYQAQNADWNAWVTADITYISYDGTNSHDPDFRLHLIWDQNSRQWLIDYTE